MPGGGKCAVARTRPKHATTSAASPSTCDGTAEATVPFALTVTVSKTLPTMLGIRAEAFVVTGAQVRAERRDRAQGAQDRTPGIPSGASRVRDRPAIPHRRAFNRSLPSRFTRGGLPHWSGGRRRARRRGRNCRRRGARRSIVRLAGGHEHDCDRPEAESPSCPPGYPARTFAASSAAPTPSPRRDGARALALR